LASAARHERLVTELKLYNENHTRFDGATDFRRRRLSKAKLRQGESRVIDPSSANWQVLGRSVLVFYVSIARMTSTGFSECRSKFL
jgi:hypothetical protein